MKSIQFVIFLLILTLNQTLFSAEHHFKRKQSADTLFTITDSVAATPVANQYKTNTCWSFSTLSFLESELIRKTGQYYNFSEMFIVRKAYEEKAQRYLRMLGNINFAGGGEPNDVLDVFKKYGFMPENAYSGLINGQLNHNHLLLDEELKKFMTDLLQNSEERLNSDWLADFNKILDTYLGEIPSEFYSDSTEFTPEKYARTIDLNYDDYVMITSFTHHPFYSAFILEVPDNWSWGEVYNVPMNELIQILENALENGYSATWSADISEKGFNFKEGIAVAPELLYNDNSHGRNKKIEKMERDDFAAKYLKDIAAIKEISVTPELRQKAFDNLTTTDDHGMHITGKAVDKNDKTFYYVKNSWGTNNPFHGFQYVSKPYFEYKTISIMLHKDAIPAEIKTKLQIN